MTVEERRSALPIGIVRHAIRLAAAVERPVFRRGSFLLGADGTLSSHPQIDDLAHPRLGSLLAKRVERDDLRALGWVFVTRGRGDGQAFGL